MEKAREIQDFGDDEYPNMICVEAGHVSAPVILLPGTAFEASEILQVMWNWNGQKNPANCQKISHMETFCITQTPKIKLFSKISNLFS